MKILPLTYLGNTEWFAQLLGGDCVIDLGENYVKQSCRNRCEIYSANGVMPLTVNVVKGGSYKKKPMRDMRIDYSKRWQHQHWVSICSAYKKSPYFDHYAERFAPFYEKQYEFLADYNLELTSLMLSLLGVDGELPVSEKYMHPSESDIDLRGRLFLASESAPLTPSPEYFQVFAERQPFVGGLSMLDLFFCEGREATNLLKNSLLR